MGEAFVSSAAGLLLDTNALLRLVAAPEGLGSHARARFLDGGEPIVVSAASAWEIAIKTRAGKLAGGEEILALWDELMGDLRAQQIAIEVKDAVLAGGLAWEHRDPFDRVLVAQASRCGLVLATSDQALIDRDGTPTLDTRV